MAHTVIRHSHVDLDSVPTVLREAHAQFLAAHRAVLVSYGPLALHRAPAGYLYQLDLPDRAAAAHFAGADPFAAAGLFYATIASEWHCALPYRLPEMPPRPGTAGFFFHGIGKPDMTGLRNSIVAAHRAHLQPRDAANCVSRGFMTDREGALWMGSAMVYEFCDRARFDDFFRTEPYCVNGLYHRIDVYEWRRGVLG